MGLIVLVIIIILLVGAFPRWPHSQNWGYGPSGILEGTVLIIVLILFPPRAAIRGMKELIRRRPGQDAGGWRG